MSCKCISNEKKVIISIQTGLIAFLIFNPATFQIVRNLLGGWVSNAEGLPTIYGLILHTLLFSILIYLLMIKKPHQILLDRPLV